MDPETRHGHKTRTRKRDGYKAHIATEPETGLVTAATLTPANTPDADAVPELVAAEAAGTEIVADSVYASGATLETFNKLDHTPLVKPIVRKPHIEGGYHRDDFKVDTSRRKVTCAAGHTTRNTAPRAPPPSPSDATVAPCAHDAPPQLGDAPSQSTNTTTCAPRTRPRWAKDETKNTYRTYRPPVERTIAWLTRGKARRVPYRGTPRNQQWLTTRTAAINLRRLINLGLDHGPAGWVLNPA